MAKDTLQPVLFPALVFTRPISPWNSPRQQFGQRPVEKGPRRKNWLDPLLADCLRDFCERGKVRPLLADFSPALERLRWPPWLSNE